MHVCAEIDTAQVLLGGLRFVESVWADHHPHLGARNGREEWTAVISSVGRKRNLLQFGFVRRRAISRLSCAPN